VRIVTRASIRRFAGVVALGAILAASSGCGEVARTGRSSAFLILESLTAASGAEGEFSHSLSSDVLTIVDGAPAIFADQGRAVLRIGLKDPGPVGSPTTASPLSQVTVNRYRVEFERTDGRNQPGVDVPFSFDGAVTATVTIAATEVTFPLVTHAMKLEPPLLSLAGGGGQVFIHTIAKVTFWGRDQAGNELTVSGLITVNFGDFADP
jgi:hypothetical protein